MKRVLLTVAVALLIPSILIAATPTVGVYFEGSLAYTPNAPGQEFFAGLYIVQNEYYVTGIEYSLVTPDDPTHTQFFILEMTYPPNFALALGDAWNGHAVSYWPPLTGYPEGYDLLVKYSCMTSVPCSQMRDYSIVVSAHPDSGFLRGTFSPDNDTFEAVGLTSYLCPQGIGTEEESWGAIKSMFR